MGPVAGAAVVGQPNRKIMKTFNRRTNDHARPGGENKKKSSGGYHRPGSMQKGRCR